MVCLKAY